MSITNEPTYDSADLADALESSVLALLRTPPIRQALHDLLRIYGMSAQSGEVLRNQNAQVQALAETMNIFLGRLIEHDRRAVQSFTNTVTILGLVQTLADSLGDPASEIAKAAADALALLNEQADIQLDMIETEAARARTLLRIAQSTARADLADAVATAQTLREDTKKETAPAITDAQALRVEATEAAEAATKTASAAAAQTLKAAAAETAATEAEAGA